MCGSLVNFMKFMKVGGRMVVDRVGNMNMFSGMFFWKVGDRRKSISILVVSWFGVLVRILVNLIWWK